MGSINITSRIEANTLTLSAPTIDNTGVINAYEYLDLLTTAGAGSFQNLTGGILTGGTYVVEPGGTLSLPSGQAITTDAADIALGEEQKV